MSNPFVELSDTIAAAVERGAASVVQIHSQRGPVAGVVFAPELIATPARALGDDTAVVRLPSGRTAEGQVLGHAVGVGLGVVQARGLDVAPAETAPEPRVGALAVAVGRTWSGGVVASVTNVAVVGGPLRTGRASQIERVIRIAQPPHGAFTGGALVDADGRVFGVITSASIRGTAVAIPAALAWDAAHHIVQRGGTRQGYLGLSTLPVSIPGRQRGTAPERGLLITGVGTDTPADAAGLCVGDIVVRFAGEIVDAPETLVTLLRGDHIGKAVALSVLRGDRLQDVAVTVGERPTRRD